MQYIGLISSSASGKAGGLVGTRGRIGTQFRARVIPRQSLTPSASETRAITGGLPALWRGLTNAERSTWQDLAASLPCRDSLGQVMTLSGYALYIACSRRLVTIGITQQLRSAIAPPSIPPIIGFTATPLYNSPSNPTALEDIQLTTLVPLPPNFIPVLRATTVLSPTRAHVRPSNLRVIEAGSVWASQPHSGLTPWLTKYGTAPFGGAILFALSLVDPITGIVGAEVRANAPYAVSGPTPPPGGALIVDVEGTTVADISGGTVQVEGTTIAS